MVTLRPLRNPLRNPNHLAGAIVCKLGTIGATILWSVMVLCKKNAIAMAAYSDLAKYVHEDVIASTLLAISTAQLYWLAAWCKPFKYCAAGYGAIWAWWTAVLVFVVFDPGPLQITPITGISLLVALASFAFVTGPRRGNDGLAG